VIDGVAHHVHQRIAERSTMCDRSRRRRRSVELHTSLPALVAVSRTTRASFWKVGRSHHAHRHRQILQLAHDLAGVRDLAEQLVLHARVQFGRRRSSTAR
jgi:hypothetical protein